MSQSQSLLIELGTEELPPKALKTLSAAFSQGISNALTDASLLSDDSKITSYATPRRLAILITGVAPSQADFSQLRKGPSVAAAFDADGKPTRAVLGFAKSCGVEIGDLGREKSKKGEWLVFEQSVSGKSIAECAQAALDATITQLPIPKRMRWGDKTAEFVRPAHWLLALYGDAVLELNALGLSAGHTSLGHRFHHPQAITVDHADSYFDTLQTAFVSADFAQRQALIKSDCEALAKKIKGQVVLSPDLLDEVTGLVEWPVAILGEFNADFLDVPREALIASMKDHQKYFHLTDSAGKLLPNFITVSNIDSRTPEKVLSGNERVLNARLSDAQFFWRQDKQRSLQSYQARLEKLLFHVKLGSVADKTRRLESVAEQYARLIGGDTKDTKRAASLCKLDLLSNMVGEFASLQGTMGRYYAQLENESDVVSDAIEQHYWPKFSGDRLPTSKPALALALADRFDTLVGIFAAGEKPSGVKDPYALRRAALGILRILIEEKLDLSLQTLLKISIDAYSGTADIQVRPDEHTQSELNKFILDRLRAYYTGQGFKPNVFNAVAAVHPDRAYDFDQRLRAVSDFFKHEKSAATALAAANKRIANILKKLPDQAAKYDRGLFSETAETALSEALDSVREPTEKAFNSQAYTSGLALLAKLEQPVNDYFDQVRVMDDNKAIRNNRLGLLSELRGLFLLAADISHLVVETS